MIGAALGDELGWQRTQAREGRCCRSARSAGSEAARGHNPHRTSRRPARHGGEAGRGGASDGPVGPQGGRNLVAGRRAERQAGERYGLFVLNKGDVFLREQRNDCRQKDFALPAVTVRLVQKGFCCVHGFEYETVSVQQDFGMLTHPKSTFPARCPIARSATADFRVRLLAQSALPAVPGFLRKWSSSPDRNMRGNR